MDDECYRAGMRLSWIFEHRKRLVCRADAVVFPLGIPCWSIIVSLSSTKGIHVSILKSHVDPLQGKETYATDHMNNSLCDNLQPIILSHRWLEAKYSATLFSFPFSKLKHIRISFSA